MASIADTLRMLKLEAGVTGLTGVIGVIGVAVSLMAWAGPAVAQPSQLAQLSQPIPAARPTISLAALEQIEASQREKAARTPAERKIDSQLLKEIQRRQNPPIAGRSPDVTPLAQDAAGRVIVDITTTGDVPELAYHSFAIQLEATQAVVAERSMYFGATPTQGWSGGHASGGSALARQWSFAEGATGSFFNTFVLLGNPQTTDAHVEVRYLLDSGDVIVAPKVVPAQGRLTINVATEATEADPRLRNAAFSTHVTSDVPIAAERSMYWPATLPWHEAHNSAGVTELATSWGIAEGRAGNAGNAGSGDEAHDFHTYLLLGNPQSSAADVTVTYLRANGTPIVKTYVVPATASSGPAAPTPSPRGCREFRALLPTPDTHALTHANQVRVWSDATIR